MNKKWILYRIETSEVVREFTYEKSAKKNLQKMDPSEYGLIFGTAANGKAVLTKTVKNLMTGEAVEIASDTPWCCNPASETYWSMQFFRNTY